MVYFLYNDKTNLVKIGYSTCLDSRHRTLSFESGVHLKLLAYIRTDKIGKKLENLFHRSLKPYRVLGEWFQFTGLLKSYIEHIGSLYPVNESYVYGDLAYFYIIPMVCENHFEIQDSFPALKKKYKNVYSKTLSCFSAIEYVWRDIGYGVTKTHLDLLDKKSIKMRYYSFKLKIENEDWYIEMEESFCLDEVSEEADRQLQSLGFKTNKLRMSSYIKERILFLRNRCLRAKEILNSWSST